MLTVRIGKRVHKTQGVTSLFIVIAVLAVLFFAIFLIMQSQKHSIFWFDGFPGAESLLVPKVTFARPRTSLCDIPKSCPEGDFSFFIASGAANVVGPKICIQNKMVMGNAKQNIGEGINIAVINGKTGKVLKTDFFDMYSGDIEPLIKFLQSIESGSVVLMASFDDPATKLNKEAKTLIRQLGSSAVDSLGFRDNWIFVGGKGAEGTEVKSTLEKHIKNKQELNKYENWPEMIALQGCIPKRLE